MKPPFERLFLTLPVPRSKENKLVGARQHLVRVVSTVVAVLVALFVVPPTLASAEGTAVTYQHWIYRHGSPGPTADKPQSKLWYNDGAWWALMVGPLADDVRIYELVDHKWRDTGVIADTRVNSTGDALWADNDKLYVASRTANGALRLYRFSYTVNRSYILDPGFPVVVANGGAESITVARDVTGRLWTTWTRSGTVYMSYTAASDSHWVEPVPVPVSDHSLDPDDISAVITFGDKVGVMWSDQESDAFRFAVHSAFALPTEAWGMETALSGARFADDHLNLKSLLVDDFGRVHAAVKTSRGDDVGDSPSDPLIMVLSRSATGSWSGATAALVSSGLSRPQLAIDSANRELYVLMTTEGGGRAYYKKAPLLNVAFTASGTGTSFMAWGGAEINNVSTTKDPVNARTGLVAVGSDQKTRRIYHAEMSLN